MFVKEKRFLRAVAGIAVPVGLQSMLQSSFAMIDQLMVGQLGSTAVSAVEVAGRPAFIYSVVVGAAAAIAGIMISQYLGKQDEEMADRSLCVNLVAALLLGACSPYCAWRFPVRSSAFISRMTRPYWPPGGTTWCGSSGRTFPWGRPPSWPL